MWKDWEKRFGDKLLFINTCEGSFKIVRNQCSDMTVSESWPTERAGREESVQVERCSFLAMTLAALLNINGKAPSLWEVDWKVELACRCTGAQRLPHGSKNTRSTHAMSFL